VFVAVIAAVAAAPDDHKAHDVVHGAIPDVFEYVDRDLVGDSIGASAADAGHVAAAAVAVAAAAPEGHAAFRSREARCTQKQPHAPILPVAQVALRKGVRAYPRSS